MRFTDYNIPSFTARLTINPSSGKKRAPARFQVLHDISLAVEQGQFVTIMGTKVTGLEENRLAKFRNEHIGFVFQFHYLLPEFTDLENVMLPALKLGRWDPRTTEEKAMALLRQMEMEQYAFKRLAQQGNTIIVVTHDRDLAGKSDRVIQLADGRVVG
ncbi:hypothetical protein [Puia dinghuensis]|uniref:Lipoprotein-releasing system ATP-binding protein LolD n=1 Tax=Puia dinghuensis TaxID=1792502 RepID=A0A8J2XSE5_9BACT|nr:hypothetical protein [Puia dinghuensis]GGA94676.1 lipoprotein-releasing system ATP-binding protein LolD [Puia dinghuensis]